MKRVFQQITTSFIYGVALLITGVFSMAAGVSVLVSPSGRLFMLVARSWGRSLLFFARVKVTCIGAEKIDWEQPAVVMSNHASLFDIPILYRSLPVGLRFLAKRSSSTSRFWAGP